MTNDEINRYIHETIRGLCWHEMIGGTFRPARCEKGCGLSLSIAEYRNARELTNPDYCSDASPRSLLNEVVAKVIEKYKADPDAGGLPDGFYLNQRTPAEQIARACVEAWKASGPISDDKDEMPDNKK